MIWTLLAFGVTLFVLNKLAFPRIAEALDRRRMAIEESIESAQRTKQEADELLEEYRARLKEAREQADDIVARARKAAESLQDEAKAAGHPAARGADGRRRAATSRHETRRALEEIRKEVADLTVLATEKVTRKSLDARRPPRPDRGGAQRGRLLRAAGEEGNGSEG